MLHPLYKTQRSICLFQPCILVSREKKIHKMILVKCVTNSKIIPHIKRCIHSQIGEKLSYLCFFFLRLSWGFWLDSPLLSGISGCQDRGFLLYIGHGGRVNCNRKQTHYFLLLLVPDKGLDTRVKPQDDQHFSCPSSVRYTVAETLVFCIWSTIHHKTTMPIQH